MKAVGPERAHRALTYGSTSEQSLDRHGETPSVQFLVKVARSFRWAGRGLTLASRGRNFRIMLGCALGVVALGSVLNVSGPSWAILLVCIAGVLGGEIMNTAIERIADRIESRWDQGIGDIKDLAAGAVLLGAALAAIVGLIVFWPYVTG